MKFLLLVEGETEKRAIPDFLKRWLDRNLTQRVGIQPIRFRGHAHFMREMAIKARMHLHGPKQDELIAVLGLLDLYGPDYPEDLTTAEQRQAWGVRHCEKQVNDDRFRMFFAVHEVEAWLLSQPENFPEKVRNAFPTKVANPEMVDFEEPPAKLLDRIYKQRLKKGYKKTVNGRELFAKLSPAVAREKCPYLQAMLDEMLEMAKAKGH
ncbi:MAG: DUF4276 family protein [Pirellulales bacterium]